MTFTKLCDLRRFGDSLVIVASAEDRLAALSNEAVANAELTDAQYAVLERIGR